MATMTMMPLVAPMATTTPTNFAAPNPIADANTAALKAIFAEVELDVLADLLAFHGNDVDKVVDMLLESSPAAADDNDAEVARRFQQEQDEAVAKAVHASLQAEMKAEDEAKRQREPAVVAARTVGAASMRAKKFLMQRASRKSTAASHEALLLEAPLEAPAYDMTPLQAPAAPAYTPPPVTTPSAASVATNDVTPAAAPAAALYSARMDRARSANRVRAQSRLSLAQPESSIALPEGELV